MTETLKIHATVLDGARVSGRRGIAALVNPVGSAAERAAVGKQQRATVPLGDHAAVGAGSDRRDPLALLEEQCVERVPELVPIRYGRMMVSAFTFYRGAARVMAADLAATGSTGLIVQLCGDAHLSNFGVFGSPERRLIFDINDFDETLPGPFEWDVKRLVASLVIAAQDSGFTRKQWRGIAQAAAARYRTAITEFAGMRDIDVWYSRLGTDEIQKELTPRLDAKRQKKLNKSFAQARTRDSMQAVSKLTETTDGQRRIVGDPPLIVPLRDMVPGLEQQDLQERFRQLIRHYRRTLEPDRRVLLERYRFVDMARKVVGVGSVGTRCWIVLLTGRDESDPLFLQVKEANTSVLAEFVGRSGYANQGQRVVSGQRVMQQASDIFLGWQRTTGIDDVRRDFYIRQLRDWKGSIEVEALLPKGLQYYGELCAWSLARAHARSGDRIAISAYLGSSDTFDRAMADFGESYAELNAGDHQLLIDAVAAERIAARTGL
ncbi:MAG TPA: DUF2252 domain-containing protein [Jatrophihabitans sp.]|nr:DUF2252 domain-containing protein [Jatrophihabitans sp.]